MNMNIVSVCLRLVLCSDPTHERRESGDVWPIPWASLINVDYFLGGNFPSSNHIAENIICSTTPEILDY